MAIQYKLPLLKIDDLKVLMTGMFDILVITETKLDNTFPISQFYIYIGFPYHAD